MFTNWVKWTLITQEALHQLLKHVMDAVTKVTSHIPAGNRLLTRRKIVALLAEGFTDDGWAVGVFFSALLSDEGCRVSLQHFQHVVLSTTSHLHHYTCNHGGCKAPTHFRLNLPRLKERLADFPHHASGVWTCSPASWTHLSAVLFPAVCSSFIGRWRCPRRAELLQKSTCWQKSQRKVRCCFPAALPQYI